MHVDFTSDAGLINSIIRRRDIYESMSDDSCPDDPSAVDISDVVNDFRFIKVVKDGNDVGVFMFIPKGGGDYEVHTMLTDACRGIDAIRAGRMAEEAIFSTVDCNKLISYSWSDSPNVAFFAKACGFRKTSEEKYHTTRKGKEVNVIYYELTKDNFQKQR